MPFKPSLLSLSALALLSAATVFPMVGLAQEAAAPEARAETEKPAITVSTVSSRLLSDRVIASGLVAAVELVNVAPLIEGQQIETLSADVGDTVEAGQILATLSRSSLELQKSQLLASLAAARATIAQTDAQVLQARTQADDAQKTNDRTLALKAAGNASQAAADKTAAAATSALAQLAVAEQGAESAKANLALVEAQIANIDLQLSRTEVRAPFAGRITARNAILGGIASGAAQPMFVLMRDGALELQADVSEGDLLRIAPGMSATLDLSASDQPHAGTVRLVEPSIDTTTRLGRVRISFDDPSEVRDGMFAEATILLDERQALSVPVTAVSSTGGKATVIVVNGDTAALQEIVTGIRDGGFVEIVEGLQEGQLVVTKAGAFVRPGDRIRPIPASETTN